MISLQERQEHYEESYDYKIIPNLPIVIKSSIRNFDVVTKNIKNPYSKELYSILQNSLLYTVKEIDGAVFAYAYNGEFSIVITNDINSNKIFCKNKIQEISSTVSSLLTSAFNKYYFASDNPPDIIGDVIFKTKSFALPSINETVNYLILKQGQCNYHNISYVSYFELIKHFSKDRVKEILESKSTDDKIDIIKDYLDLDIYDKYDQFFLNGWSCYKAPQIISSGDQEITKKRWLCDLDFNYFVDNRDGLRHILMTGQDVFVPERDIIKK
jgi:hypothetical protein